MDMYRRASFVVPFSGCCKTWTCNALSKAMSERRPGVLNCHVRRRQSRGVRWSDVNMSISEDEDAEIIAYGKAVTMGWVRKMVIGLHLCPFAEGVIQEDSHHVVVSLVSTEQGVRNVVAQEIENLISTSSEEISTTLVVLPRFCTEDFMTFHTMCLDIEEEVEMSEDLVDEVMLAYFHPLHEWGNVEDGEVEAVNFDKRAPLPVINLLRAKQVDRYVEEGKTEHIVEKNRRTLEKVGTERLEDMFRRLRIEAVESIE